MSEPMGDLPGVFQQSRHHQVPHDNPAKRNPVFVDAKLANLFMHRFYNPARSVRIVAANRYLRLRCESHSLKSGM